MAKKGPRVLISLKCQKCGKINYTSEKNRTSTKGKLLLRKFCPKCRRYTEHIEVPVK